MVGFTYFIETFKSYVRCVTAISNCLTLNASCFGNPIDSNSDMEPCVDIVPVADAKSSVDVSSPEPGDRGDSNCSESLKIFMDTSVEQTILS